MSLLLSCVAREWRTSGALDRIATSLLLENRGHDALTMASKSRVDLFAESTPRTVSHKFLRRRRRRVLLTLFGFLRNFSPPNGAPVKPSPSKPARSTTTTTRTTRRPRLLTTPKLDESSEGILSLFLSLLPLISPSLALLFTFLPSLLVPLLTTLRAFNVPLSY